MDDGWRRWFVRDDRLRALWRALLFVILFLAILQAALLFVPLTDPAPAGGRLGAGLPAALILQSLLLLVAALIAGWAMLRWVDRRPAETLGFPLRRRVPREIVAGLAIGAGALAAIVLLFVTLGAYRYAAESGSITGWIAIAGLSLAGFALPAAAEEAVFRGYLFRTIVEGAGSVIAILVTSALFALVHGANPNVSAIGLLNIFLAGVLLAVAVLRTGTLWLASAVHLGWNWVMAGPLDLPVSGLDAYDTPLYDAAGAAPGWLTGGAFGPEGGLAGTLAAALALGLVWWTTRPGAALAGGFTTEETLRRHDRVHDR